MTHDLGNGRTRRPAKKDRPGVRASEDDRYRRSSRRVSFFVTIILDA
ncbi:hypothetical protein [Fulvimarina sp. MAC8]